MALIDDLSSYYKLDESSGVAIDIHGSNNGVVTGATQNVSGKINTAYSFDGINDYVTVADDNTLDFTTALSINLWVNKNSSQTGNPRFLSKRSGQSSAYNFGILDTGNLYAELLDSAFDTGDSFSADVFHMVTLTFSQSSGNVKMYIDATEVLSDGGHGSDTITTTGDPLYFAQSVVGSDEFKGVLDEIGLWNKELDSSEVTALYNSGNGLSYPFSLVLTNMQINIGDVWKEVPAIQINIGDTWKEVVSVKQNIGDNWKEVF